ncbi:hypothetical protein [Alteribacillus bidgolensis]|uniref:Uncharacterized protein n=1 Tax=Alteribacillus bidgolensis TaxID=930129 RepID=A0A1G8P5L1_9BACI|nr:hypothetical protein [Alteribacillus bidgolensis]SDI87722.1 hypothetical protein SAMN05216352_113129 [Alteribacillus bidgolensis]
MLKSAIYFPPRKRPEYTKETRRKHLLRMLEENEQKLRKWEKREEGADYGVKTAAFDSGITEKRIL